MSTVTPSAPRSSDAAGQNGQDNKARPPAEQMKLAMDRIELSRSALIVCLSSERPERHNEPTPGTKVDGSAQSVEQTLAARIKRNGLLRGSWHTLRVLARRWWTRQPWHSSVDLIGETLAHQARPLMRRHPLATLAVGTAIGAGLVSVVSTVRPWAWLQTRNKASSWGERVGNLLWTQLSSAPLQMALAGALAAWLTEQSSHRRPHPNEKPINTVSRSDQPDTAPSSDMARDAT